MEFKLPDIGEGIHEGEIVKWLVSDGDSVKEDQPLVEVMTDKATVELPSPVEGFIEKILVQNGEVVKVGQPMVIIGDRSKAVSKTTIGAVTKTVEEPEKQDTPQDEQVNEKIELPTPATDHVLATPATRKYAREHNVEINKISGTGPRARVLREDIDKYIAKVPAEIPEKQLKTGSEKASTPKDAAFKQTAMIDNIERIPMKGIRKRISDHMIESKLKAAHFTHIEEADCTHLVDIRKRILESTENKELKLTFLPFIMKSVIFALAKFPFLNSSLDLEKNEIILKRYYNIGFAVDTPSGLIVPVIKNVDQKNILELAKEIQVLSEAVIQGKAKLDDLQGGTFTITNIGSIGGMMSTPILNYPEVAILAVHKILIFQD